MQINLNKQFKFTNFSIRAYVAEIRRRDPQKCWPFGSLAAPNNDEVFASYHESAESTFLSSQNCPIDINDSDDTQEHIEAPNSCEVEICIGKEEQPEAKTDMISCNGSTSCKVNNARYGQENGVNDGTNIGDSTLADDIELKGKLLQRKPQKFRLLSDIYNDPASEIRPPCDITNPVNFKNRFVTDSDESNDDVTLIELIRKRKRLKGTGSTLRKKRKTIQTEEPRDDPDKKSKHGPGDSSGNDPAVDPKVHSRKKTRIDDLDIQNTAKHIKVGPSSSMVVCEKNSPFCVGSKEKELQKQKDFELPCHQKANRTEATEAMNEESEMEAVMLLAHRFNKVNCVHKETATKRLENVFCSVQMNDHLKGTTASVLQAQLEICLTDAGGVASDAQNYETLVCSLNRNPADFSISDAEDEFMRGV